jgi:hypothetical protein
VRWQGEMMDKARKSAQNKDVSFAVIDSRNVPILATITANSDLPPVLSTPPSDIGIMSEAEIRQLNEFLSKYIIYEANADFPEAAKLEYTYYHSYIPSITKLLQNKYPEDEHLKKAAEIIAKIKTPAKQGELFPVFTLPKKVFLKKEFSLNFGATDRIRKNFPEMLKKRLTNGKTLSQQLDEVDKWFSNLRGKDLILWIKLFAYIQEVKEHDEAHRDTVNIQPVRDRPGCYVLKVHRNKDFFSFFIRPDKKSGQITGIAKENFLKWLNENQKEIIFPLVIDGQLWAGPVRIYKYWEEVTGNALIFEVDTNILESEFRNYISIPIEELDVTADLWEAAAPRFKKFKKFTSGMFSDLTMKFLIALKNSYNDRGDFETVKGYKGNVQRFHKETLDQRLGGLSDRIQKHLKGRGAIRTGKTSPMILNIKREILETLFDIAIQRGWIFSCKFENENYRFSLNAGFFAPKNTAQRLVQIENGGGSV